jgi:signal transduction histidine kinase
MLTSRPTDLKARLTELCLEFQAGGIACDVHLDDRHVAFGEEVGEIVFRTVRELLTNVRQHARARHVTLSSADRRDGSVAITVADDGIGLPAHRRRGKPFGETGGIGLWSIDQRLRELDAMLDIEAESGHGTRATVILPLTLLDSPFRVASYVPRS